MQIIFTTKKMQKACSSEREMLRIYGDSCSKKLKQRLAELEAAENMGMIPPFARCHPLTGKLNGKYAVDLAHPYRLIFEPDCEELPLKADGGLDLNKVTSIIIKDITDYH
ncbi:MAG: killer suppression protein HigA [Candidatus Cloacimonetes bacterium]|jgi:proteic killer suppression protein|nr:type II toxin-antitoxin system RelE/ParE family toxin [Candidatus Cloacimonadota bacterium]MDD2422683.1 killer suppression protein HigA [Candidatus Cloacimonadota bacterium]